MKKMIQDSLGESLDKLQQFMSNAANIEAIEQTALAMAGALKAGNKIISCGNGGSLCDASHFAEELTGRYRTNREPLPAVAINDPAYITCVGNDFSFEEVFSRYVEAFGQKGDVLLAISTSGNSTNVVNAALAAKNKGMSVVALTGDSDNLLRKHSDIAVCAPVSGFSDRMQEIHIKVIHVLIQLIEKQLYGL
ncbi:D-sedoheptulose 7-phosphate isomerase [Maribellus luteus]|uniref:Phosphoheptose isomerase n=1 Tax=Maribellus luteus TaxID=2305463 RepID=A0A399T670_9BACT|nr:D-sedoheptulose 7-phosphate isomerase [Maribellus luteus]RIJ50659.1 D-sedoheptulose 7-phosphate isomerase [Maribellus luteus]